LNITLDGSFVHWNAFIAGLGGSHIRVKERKDTFSWFTACPFMTVVGVDTCAEGWRRGAFAFRVLGIESIALPLIMKYEVL
jgi:hypothetical protein